MKKFIEKSFSAVKRNMGRIFTVLVMTSFAASPVFASMNGGSAFKGVMKFLADWTVWLGLAIAFFGAVQIGFGFRSDDAEGKNKGLRAMIAGFIVMAIGLAWNTFGGYLVEPVLTL